MKKAIRLLLIFAVNTAIFVAIVAAVEYASSLAAVRLGRHIVADYYLNHTWKPGGYFVHDEWIADNPRYPEPYTHRYNKQGWLEDYDIAEVKEPNTYRIFYLGDSFTEGAVRKSKAPSRTIDNVRHWCLRQLDRRR